MPQEAATYDNESFNYQPLQKDNNNNNNPSTLLIEGGIKSLPLHVYAKKPNTWIRITGDQIQKGLNERLNTTVTRPRALLLPWPTPTISQSIATTSVRLAKV